jgi:predicted nucleic acid-binding protein
MKRPIVIDNSVVMSWCFEDEASDYADSVLNALKITSAMVPSIWPYEFVNVLLVAERQKRLKQAESVQFVTLLSELSILVDEDSPEKSMKDVLALGRETGLSSYDAAYLELAMRNGFPLATLDKKLTAAAKAVDVNLFDLS